MSERVAVANRPLVTARVAVANRIATANRRKLDVFANVPWVAQWKFNNNGNDSIGANNLTNNNAATFAAGKLGGATGATKLVAVSSQYWSIPDNAALSMGDIDFTLLAWVYLDSKANDMGLVCKDIGGSNRDYSTIYFQSTDTFRFTVGNGGSTIIGAVNAVTFGPPALATWYLLAAWHDSVADTVNIQINNGAIDSAALTGVAGDGTAAFQIGWRSATNFHNGRIDNVCIAKSAAGGGGVLTAMQRTAFYNNGAGTEVIT